MAGRGAFRVGSDWVARQVHHIEGYERAREDLPVDGGTAEVSSCGQHTGEWQSLGTGSSAGSFSAEILSRYSKQTPL